ncbi:MAG: NAD-dependent epimerase/dehydratase family protein [Pseudomonadota bacterium]
MTDTALVTGADGFVGRHLVRALTGRGVAVRALDLAFGAPLPDGATPVRADILDAAALRPAMAGVDVVYHLAAISDLWVPPSDPGRHHRVNVGGTRAVLAAAIEAGPRRIVHCSSNVVLIAGPRTDHPVDEGRPPPRETLFGAYAKSKADAEDAVAAARDRIETVIVRPGTPIGPGDHRPTPPGRLLRDLANGAIPALPRGGSINLVDVAAMADAMAAAGWQAPADARYLLTGKDLSFGALADILAGVTGRPMPRERVPYPVAWTAAVAEDLVWSRITGRPPAASFAGVRMAARRRRFSNAPARAELGLRPTDVAASVTRALHWMVGQGTIRRDLPGLPAALARIEA